MWADDYEGQTDEIMADDPVTDLKLVMKQCGSCLDRARCYEPDGTTNFIGPDCYIGPTCPECGAPFLPTVAGQSECSLTCQLVDPEVI